MLFFLVQLDGRECDQAEQGEHEAKACLVQPVQLLDGLVIRALHASCDGSHGRIGQNQDHQQREHRYLVSSPIRTADGPLNRSTPGKTSGANEFGHCVTDRARETTLRG
jgi:hypothetical protein